MSGDIPWPRKDDVAFGTHHQPDFDLKTIAMIGRLIGLPDATIHSDAFRECADLIVDRFESGYPFSTDKFFLPIAFLYRHAIELSLKDAVAYAKRIMLVPDDANTLEAMSEHNLYRLWNLLKPAILEFWPGGDKNSIRSAERIISEFHEIDKTGQGFRYPNLKDGRPSLQGGRDLPEAVDLVQLKKVAGGLCNFLNGCASGFIDAYSNMPRGEW